MKLDSSTYYIGIITGLLLPLITNIYPIKKAMSHTLRDSLDLSRQSVDELEVECVRLENKGVNTSQMYLSGSILVICFNAIEFIFNSIYWGVVVVPVLAATP